MQRIRPSANPSILMVGNDTDDLSVKDWRFRPGKFDQFLKTGPSPLLIAARKD
jgi:hypothetical protein